MRSTCDLLADDRPVAPSAHAPGPKNDFTRVFDDHIGSVMSKLLVRIIYWAVSGSLAAACMTVIRMAARRHGIIDKTVPQAAEEWLADRTGMGRGAHPVVHHLVDQGMHLMYGAALGVGYAVATRKRRRLTLAHGLGYGLATWFTGSRMLLPLLGAKQPPGRKRRSENAVDLLAHLAFGAATAIVSEQFSMQSNRGPSSDVERRNARVG